MVIEVDADFTTVFEEGQKILLTSPLFIKYAIRTYFTGEFRDRIEVRNPKANGFTTCYDCGRVEAVDKMVQRGTGILEALTGYKDVYDVCPDCGSKIS